MAPTIGVNLRVTGHCNQGSRRHMEDMFSVAYQQTEDELDLEYAYFGIFDGHGGHEAATFAKEHLMKAIVSQPGFWSDNDNDVLRAIKDGFIATHYAMWRNLENWPKTQSGWPSTSGTTASIAFIRRSNIYIGHVGDSCIVLGYQDPCSDLWRGAALTQDHKPENPAEFKRISQAGGMVNKKSGVPRVVWHRPRLSHKGPLTRSTHIDQIPFLAVARSLGDLWSYNADSDRFVVSPEPDVSVHHIDLTHHRCLIFGTDGLWNMLSPDEAVSIVKKAEYNNRNGNGIDGQDRVWLNPSKCLVDNALSKWMKFELRADNTSAVTLLLDPLGPPHSQVLNQKSAVANIQSEFVPYHIESFKVNESKLPNKLHSQSSGLAICTWYPHRTFPENLGGDEATTLSAMEELFGKKVEIFNCKSENTATNECKSEESRKVTESNPEVMMPTTSKTEFENVGATRKLPPSPPPLYSTVLKNPHRSKENLNKTNLKSEEKTFEKCTSAEGDNHGCKKDDGSGKISKDENDNQEVDENVNQRKLCGSSNKSNSNNNNKNNNHHHHHQHRRVSDERIAEGTLPKNYQKNPYENPKRNGRRNKKKKNYTIIESRLDLSNERKILRSRGKRRHSSLFETMNLVYEPKPKRRTRSEDQKKPYESEDYKSDTENKLEEGIDDKSKNKSKAMKTKSSDCGKSSRTGGESTRQNHLQERLQINNSNNRNHNDGCNNNNNNNNNNNKTSIGSSHGSNGGSIQGFTPMRLRSTMPVKTLRSRNINLEMCDWFFLGLTKYNVNSNKRSMSKQQSCKVEESCDSTKNISKLNILTRSSINSAKIQMNELPYRSAVRTRSQNKRLKK